MSILVDIVKFSTLFHVAALFVYILCVRKITPFSFVFVGVLVIDVLHTGWEYFLAGFFADESLAHLVTFGWYIGFAVTDFMFVGAIYFVCHKYHIVMDKISSLICYMYVYMGTLQIVRYVERIHIDSELMGYIYKYSIVSINVVVAILLVFYTFKAFVDNIARRNAAW